MQWFSAVRSVMILFQITDTPLSVWSFQVSDLRVHRAHFAFICFMIIIRSEVFLPVWPFFVVIKFGYNPYYGSVAFGNRPPVHTTVNYPLIGLSQTLRLKLQALNGRFDIRCVWSSQMYGDTLWIPQKFLGKITGWWKVFYRLGVMSLWPIKRTPLRSS